jgi:hypothetical protein
VVLKRQGKHGACQINNYLKLLVEFVLQRIKCRNFLFLFSAPPGRKRRENAFWEGVSIDCFAEKHHFFSLLQVNKN